MTKREFLEIVTTINLAYRNARPIEDMKMAEVWYQSLKDLDYETVKQAAMSLIMTSHFPPEISDIRKAVLDITSPTEMTSTEAWGLVYKAISNAGYHAREEFEKLPEICQRAVGSPEALKEMSMMDITTVNSVWMSHFVRNYDVEVKRKRETAQISQAMRNLIPERMRHMIPDKGPEKLNTTQPERRNKMYTRKELDELREKYGVPKRAS